MRKNIIKIKSKLKAQEERLPFGLKQDVLLEPRKSLTDKEFKNLLQKNGLKITTQRLHILKVLNQGPYYHKTAKNILHDVQRVHPSINFATVYRLLKILTKSKLVSKISMGSACACYEFKSNQSHYHIACIKCGTIIEFKSKIIEDNLQKILKEKNYKLQNQVLEIYVTCDKKKCNL